jgi:hypothetical protein
MKRGQNTTNRLPTDAPTERGWYYIKFCGGLIEPHYFDGYDVFAYGHEFPLDWNSIIWFGPVATCIEA